MALFIAESPRLILATIDKEDIEEAQSVFEATPTYHQMLFGKKADPEIAQRCYAQKAPRARHGFRVWKYFMGMFTHSKEMIGVLDLFVGYPRYDIATLATFMIREKDQKKGLGREGLETLTHWLIQRHPAVQTLEISITDDNIGATKFLLKMGFERTNTWNKVKLKGQSKLILLFQMPLKRN